MHGVVNINEQYQFFHNITEILYNKCFPKKLSNADVNQNPWLTYSLINCCRKKNNLYKIFLIGKNYRIENKYKIYKYTLTRDMHKQNISLKSYRKLKEILTGTWKI